MADPRMNPLLPVDLMEADDSHSSIAMQSLSRLGDLASCWWTILEMLRETDDSGTQLKGTLPQWARERIGDWRQQDEAHAFMQRLLDDARQAVAVAEGQAERVFEIWTKRGQRLDGRYQFRVEADAALRELASRFPDAYVCRVHVRAPRHGFDDPALLDTLIGRLVWAGCSFERDEEDLHVVQDATGRCVTVPAGVLLAHPAFQQMSKKGQERVQFSHERRCARQAREGAGHV